jgi:hypothetical protein
MKIKINRTKHFDLEHLRSYGGPNHKVCYEHPTSLTLNEISLDDIVIQQDDIPGEEGKDPWRIPLAERFARLDRLGLIPADAQIFQALWNNRRHLPERFKPQDPKKVFELRFLGTLFSSEGISHKCILWMNYDLKRGWHRGLTGSVFPDKHRPLVLIRN